jgi:hypothetical protein
MPESRAEPDARQAAVGELHPFLVIPRRDGNFSVAARAEDGTIYLAPLVSIPDGPKKRLLECPCCGRGIVWSEWPDGRATLEPLPKQNDDGDIPF